MELRMRPKDREKLKQIEQVHRGHRTTAQAGRALGLTQRQVQRILAQYHRRGDVAVIHRSRGRRSNHAIDPQVLERAKGLLTSKYKDFGPTLAAEHLADDDGIGVSRETVRGWMLELGRHEHQRKKRPHRQRRERRACLGELVQMDTSDHDWLEGRGPACVLIAMIDDATGRKLLRFFPADSTRTNMALIKLWIERHGRPRALYTDRASHFRQVAVAGRKPSQTQIERALGELEIELICAHSPQAKGRVERSHGIDQDRLIKEMRLAGIATLAAANRFVDRTYLPKMERKFGMAPASAVDAHRSAEGFDLEAILSVQESRRVANDFTVQIDGVTWQIERGEIGGGLRQGKAIVERRLDGQMRLRWGERYLNCRRAPTASRIELEPGTAPGVGGVALREGSLRSLSRNATTPPTPAIAKPKYKPAPDHPWR